VLRACAGLEEPNEKIKGQLANKDSPVNWPLKPKHYNEHRYHVLHMFSISGICIQTL